MRTILIKKTNKSGDVYFEKTREMKAVKINNGSYVFKDFYDHTITPTDKELKLYNESSGGGITVKNGWLTFIGILTLLNVIVSLILII